jgi:hypothetical protein
MINLTQKDILFQYDDFKKSANKAFQDGNIEFSLKQIEVCAKLAYNFNFFYTDKDLEQLLSNISKKIKNKSDENFIPIKRRYALIDTDGSDNHGLTQQYIRALIYAGVEFVYIYEDADLGRIKVILEELEAYPKASIYTFDKEYTAVEKATMIIEFLSAYKPDKYIMHIMPWDVVAILVCNSLTNVSRYNINATDHAFWLGASCIDYCIEFRNYGFSVSLDKRGLRSDQLLMMPYYPMINKTEFTGFPNAIPEGAVKIFSGGAFFKVYGENGLYFDIIKRLLIENPLAVLLYAGVGDGSKFKSFISENNFQKRIFILGNRKDINEVFDNCDFYLGTYPLCGGLMSQYAAIKGKPILAYTDTELAVNFVEGIICHQHHFNFTHTDLDSYFKQAAKLCNDIDYRMSEGKEFSKCVISPELFNEELKNLLVDNKNSRIPQYETIDYDRFSKIYLEVENKFQHSSQLLIGSVLRFKMLYKCPKVFINVGLIVLKKVFS